MTTAPVIVLNWNGWENTFSCLDSLRACPDVEEVWLIDNHSREDRSAEACRYYPRLRALRWDANYGYAGGNNRALRLALAEGCTCAYLLNNDCLVRPGFLSAVIEAIDTNPRLGAVGSIVESAAPPGLLQFDGRNHPDGAQASYHLEGIHEAGYFSGAAVMLRLAALQECGYLDERLFLYGEEVEWSTRARRHGWSIAVCGDSRVVHIGSASEEGMNGLYFTTRNRFIWLELVDATQRREARCAAIYSAVVGTSSAWRSGHQAKWFAIASGLRDGLSGRFGGRSDRPLGPGFRALLAWWTLQARTRDKWRHIRGRPPGYPSIESLLGL